MTERLPDQLHDEFRTLTELLVGAKDPAESCAAVAHAARRVVTGADRAGVAMLQPDGSFVTLYATDEAVERADDIQRVVGEGPCLEASSEQHIQRDDDLTVEPTWPRFAARLIEETPIRASLACPLVMDGHRGGALNLFADRAGAFTDESVTTASLLAAFASVAVAATAERQRAEQFRTAMETSRTIGAAVGMLMATHDLKQDDAFALLSSASQRLNRKLRDLAGDIVAGRGPLASS